MDVPRGTLGGSEARGTAKKTIRLASCNALIPQWFLSLKDS
jgi:hypothetical protein